MSTPRGPPRPNRRHHTLWIALTVIVVAAIAYFLFFTATPDEGTRDAAGVSTETSEPASDEAPVTLPAD